MRLSNSEVRVVCSYLFVIIRVLFPKLDNNPRVIFATTHLRERSPSFFSSFTTSDRQTPYLTNFWFHFQVRKGGFSFFFFLVSYLYLYIIHTQSRAYFFMYLPCIYTLPKVDTLKIIIQVHIITYNHLTPPPHPTPPPSPRAFLFSLQQLYMKKVCEPKHT